MDFHAIDEPGHQRGRVCIQFTFKSKKEAKDLFNMSYNICFLDELVSTCTYEDQFTHKCRLGDCRTLLFPVL